MVTGITRQLIVWLFGLVAISASQLAAAATESSSAAAEMHLLRANGRIVDSIVIDTRDVFDASEPRYQTRLFRFANRFHVTTRESIVRSELLLHAGARFSHTKASEMLRNLRTRYLFRDVQLQTEELPSGNLLIRIITVDQWSLTGGIKLSRETDRTDFQFGLEERNLFGLHSRLSLDYFARQIDNDFFQGAYSDNRLGRLPFGLGLAYSDDELGRLRSAYFRRPFYDLTQNWSWSLAVSTNRRRADVYESGELVAQWRETADRVEGSLVRRWGEDERKVSVGLDYRYNEQKIAERAINTSPPVGTTFTPEDFPFDSLTQLSAIGVRLEEILYSERRRIDVYDAVEDKAIGFHIGGDIGRAFTSGFRDYDYDRFSLVLGWGLDQRGSLLQTSFLRQLYFRGTQDIRQTSVLDAKYYYTNLHPATIAVRSIYLSDRRANATEPLNLGSRDGIRSFSRYARQGSRLHAVNAEARVWTGLQPLSMPMAIVLFLDLGAVWKSDEGLQANRYVGSPGLGLRFSLERLFRNDVVRIDFGRSDDGKWSATFGLGQYF